MGLLDSRAAGAGTWALPFHAPYTKLNPLRWDSEGRLQPLQGVCLTDTDFLVSLQQEGDPEQAGLLLTGVCPSSSDPQDSQHFPQRGVEWAPAHCRLSPLPGDARGISGLVGLFEVTHWGARSIEALCCSVSTSTTWHACFFPPCQHPLLLLLLALLEARQELGVTRELTGCLTAHSRS